MSENNIITMLHRVLMLRHAGKVKGVVTVEAFHGSAEEYPLEMLHLVDNSFVTFFDGRRETLYPATAVKRIVIETSSEAF